MICPSSDERRVTSPLLRPPILAWCLYDWANSAFPTIVTTFVFSTYYTQKIATDPITGTAEWGKAVALSGLVVALLSPLLGSIADKGGVRKPWLGFFTIVTIISSALLWFAEPTPEFALWTLFWVFVGTIGFEFCMVFYNAMLQDIAPSKYIGRVSGLGWGLGYMGGILSLVIALCFLKADFPIQITGPWVALWFFIFAIPLFLFTPDRSLKHISAFQAIQQGVRELIRTLQKVWQHREIAKFLIAHMIYNDGLTLVFTFGGIYAAGTIGMSFEEVLVFGIAMNVVACMGAIAFGWLDDARGAKETILISLVAMTVLSSLLLMADSKLWFWILALLLGVFVGPAQAASRSLMTRLSPPHLVTEMFGLYALAGKATAFLGPLLLGLITVHFNSQRMGMVLIVVFLSVGALLLNLVREPMKA